MKSSIAFTGLAVAGFAFADVTTLIITRTRYAASYLPSSLTASSQTGTSTGSTASSTGSASSISTDGNTSSLPAAASSVGLNNSTFAATNALAFNGTYTPQATLSIFNACPDPNSDDCKPERVTYFASVVTAAPSATVFAIDAAQKDNTTMYGSPITVTQGPNTFARMQPFETDEGTSDNSTVVVNNAVVSNGTATANNTTAAPTKTGYLRVSCAIATSADKVVSAECLQVASQPPSVATTTLDDGTVQTYTVNRTDVVNPTITMKFAETNIHYNPLIVTAGAEKLINMTTSATKTPISPSSTTNVGTIPTTKGSDATTRNKLSATLAGGVAILFAVLIL